MQQETTQFELNNYPQGQYPQGQPQYPQPNVYPPQQPGYAPMPDYGAFANCNQGLANGFGPMFFNVRDPSFNKKNTPVKQTASLHLCVIIPNLLFIGAVVTGVIGIDNFFSLGAAIGIMVGLYLLYLIFGCCCSDIKEYIQNMKRFDNYQSTYDQMVKGQGYFSFWIECYHYETYHDSKGRSHTRKVVTHTAR